MASKEASKQKVPKLTPAWLEKNQTTNCHEIRAQDCTRAIDSTQLAPRGINSGTRAILGYLISRQYIANILLV